MPELVTPDYVARPANPQPHPHLDDDDGDHDIYIMMRCVCDCLSVTKNEHLLKGLSVCL